LPPGRSRSLLHFVVLGSRVNAANSAEVRTVVESAAGRLATSPEISDLTAAEICSIANFNISAIAATGAIKGFNYQSCADKKFAVVRQAPAPKAKLAVTSSKYDVVEKPISQLRADMESGATTSEEITQAYLDRIEYYDKGQLGFHAYEIVATDA